MFVSMSEHAWFAAKWEDLFVVRKEIVHENKYSAKKYEDI